MRRLHDPVPPSDPLDWLRSLAEPTRPAVVRALAPGPMIAGDLAAALGVTAFNLTGHLAALRDVAMIAVRKDRADRRFLWYSLVGATAAKGWLQITHPSGLTVWLRLG